MEELKQDAGAAGGRSGSTEVLATDCHCTDGDCWAAELQVEIERLRLDAERYLWLRDQSMQFDQVGAFTPYAVQGQTLEPLEGGALDAAIDAAMKGG